MVGYTQDPMLTATTITSTLEISSNEYRKALLKKIDKKKSYTKEEIKDIINETLFDLLFVF